MFKRAFFVILGLDVLCAALFLCLFFGARCAFAQDTVALATPAGAELVPDELAEQAFNAVAIGDWWGLVAVVILALTWAIKSGTATRWFSVRWPRVAAFFDDPLASFLLPLVLAGAPITYAAIKGGSPFTLGLLLAAVVKAGGGAQVFFLGIKKALERRELKRAAAAEAEAKKRSLAAFPPGAVALLLMPLLLLTSSCSSVKGYLVSGETLDQAGAQFEIAAPIFFRECEAQRLPVDTCRKWRDFATRFKTLYRPSVNAWHAAALVNEAAVTRRYSDMVGPLLAELTDFSSALAKAGLLPGGAR